MAAMTNHYGKTLDALAHEIWAAAQLAPGEGVADGVARVEVLLRQALERVAAKVVAWDVEPETLDAAIDNAMSNDFEQWWQKHGQFCRAGGGSDSTEVFGAWLPIETAPANDKSDYFFCLAAWGPDEDKTTGCAMRYKDEWFAGSLFYKMMARHDEQRFEFREHRINPTHWMPKPEAPNANVTGLAPEGD